MATLKQAKIWMGKGKKVFRESERRHIYSMKDGKYICSCGRDVDWRISIHAQDFQIYKKPKIRKYCIADSCPECGMTLDGDYCNSCNVRWKFALREKNEVVE